MTTVPTGYPHRPGVWQRMTRASAWPAWSNVAVIVGVIGVALWQLHPELLLANTTTAGGDTGAHVMLPAYMKSNLLTHGQLTGWDPAWYDGFPLYTFYFPLPAFLTVIFSWLTDYNVAFKLVTVLGTVTLPIAAWAFGRMSGLRDPGPGCLAAATLPFLFEPSFSNYGGNLLSTLAGEFSYSLGLSVALVFLGLVALGLRTGRYRALAAVVLAATLLCHLITFLFAVLGMGVWLILDADIVRSLTLGGRSSVAAIRRWLGRLVWLVAAGAIGVGLTAWWLVPFVVDQPYATDMGWQNVGGYLHLLFPGSSRWVWIAALVGLALTVLRRNRVGLFITVMGVLSAAVVRFVPQGPLYNVRFLPFWFLCLYLMGGIAMAETVGYVARWWRRRQSADWVRIVQGRMAGATAGGWQPGERISRFRRPVPRAAAAGAVVGPLLALVAVCVAVVPPLALPATTLASIGVNVGPNQPGAWAVWNYSGYERKPDFPEYRAVVAMMAKVGVDQGCGRTMWEYDPSLNRFGTTESLMLLPYWTDGCIDSMEGLLFESSATTPYHFLNQSELSVTPSDAMNGLQYGGLNVTLGVQHLQALGVRYYLASSTTTEQQAATDPDLTEVASSGPWQTSYNGSPLATTWKVYRVADSGPVQPLADRPVVWKGVGASQSSWLKPSEAWYLNPSGWNVVPAADGPADWTRVQVGDTKPTAVPEPATTVSHVTQTDSSISFHVDRVGTPVEVKVSYFPNWHVSGADGPWRVAPNLMVVVPTSHDVTLTYGASPADRVGQVVTLASVAAAVTLAVFDRRRRRACRRRAAGEAPLTDL